MNTHKLKIVRKKKKFVARFQVSKDIYYSDLPTTNIILCNIGQATGLVKEDVHKLVRNLSQDIELPKFIAEKGESHSYVVFRDVESAIRFYNAYDGNVTVDAVAVLYMIYVKDVPQHEIVCNHENPQGLTILEDFITQDEEKYFINIFDWKDHQSSNLKNRQVKHFGYEFRYGSNDVDVSSPLDDRIPDDCVRLWERLKEKGFDVGRPNQLTVNKYTPGQGIPSHVDKHSPFGSTILSLSLGSNVVIEWRHRDGRHVPVLVRARSMMVMQGEARYDWQHGIQPRTYDPVIESRTSADTNKTTKVLTSDTVSRQTRISLTFRWTRQGPCECGYKTLCDSVVQKTNGDIQDELAASLEEIHVHQVYERIAGHFSSTRHKPWPRVVQFMCHVPAGAVVVDLGCGNGKNILPRDDIYQIAAERSAGLLSECKDQCAHIGTCDCVRVDALSAGLRDHCADAVICVAVIHHFSSELRRLQAVSTIVRLLRPNGRALITVWAKDQTKSNYLVKNKQPSEEQTVTVGGLNLPVHENRTQFQHNDVLVPWKLRNKVQNKLSNQPESTLLRYYHVFEENELEKLCSQLPNIQLEDSFYEEGNWCVVLRKI